MNPTEDTRPPVHHSTGSRRLRAGKLYLIAPVLALLLVGVGGYLFFSHPAQSQTVTLAGPAELKMLPVSSLSEKARNAPDAVRDAYRFAAANPDVLSKIPCYCGCGQEGHQSNLNCYVKETKTDGSIVFDDHALGCGICVDIARDVMLLMQEGKSLKEIRAYIDAQYAKFGQPTKTEPVL
jgi:hypothetical protein